MTCSFTPARLSRTVLAPGYNVYHYNHIHVDLMRRESGRHPCRPDAIPGEEVAAKARAVYASKQRGPAYTGSLPTTASGKLPVAIPGEDGLCRGRGRRCGRPAADRPRRVRRRRITPIRSKTG